MKRGIAFLAFAILCFAFLSGCNELLTVQVRVMDPESGRLNTLFNAGQRIGIYAAMHNPEAVSEISKIMRDSATSEATGKGICQSYLIRVTKVLGQRLNDPPVKNAAAELQWLIRAESRAEIFAPAYRRYTLAFLSGLWQGVQILHYR